MDHSLSGKEMIDLVGGRANIMNYRDLQKYDNIDDALGEYGALILLYESRDNYGHWTLVFKTPEGYIEHFDSYGYKPDEEIKGIPEYYRKKNYNKVPHLTYLLFTSRIPVRFSQYKLQKKGPMINTCGRWVGLRLLLRDLTEDQFKDLMTANDSDPANANESDPANANESDPANANAKKRGLSPDELVTIVTDHLMNR